MSKSQPGYYPGFHTLDQKNHWDAATRKVVLDRVNDVPEIRFFKPEQARMLEAVCARILPQDDRDEAHKIPIVPWIDERLFTDRHDGYRFEDMPPDREAYRSGTSRYRRHCPATYTGEAFARSDLASRTKS